VPKVRIVLIGLVVCIVTPHSTPLAGTLRPNAQIEAASQKVLAALSEDRVRALMEDFNRALGVECTHCHVQDQWTDETKPTFATARNMIRMVDAVNEKLAGVGRPSRVPRTAMDAELARWPAELTNAPESQKNAMTVYNVTLGVGCDHCHSSDWKNSDKAPMKMVKLMASLFAEFPKYMPATARTQCYMCHKGNTRPQLTPPLQ